MTDPARGTALRILHLEDEPEDQEIARDLLARDTLSVELLQVATREEYLAALRREPFDVILADYRLPGFDGLEALRLAREHVPATPFILLAGNIGEEFAVEILKLGATDFVLKDRPLRLVSSIERALREAAAERARRLAEESAAAAGRRYRALYDENPSIYFTLDEHGTILSVNRFGAERLGFTREELLGRRFRELYCEADRDTAERFLASAIVASGQVQRWELRKVARDGALVWMRDTARLTVDEHGRRLVLIVAEDTTETWELSAELFFQATHDTVTGLLNRREFERRLKSCLDEGRHERSSHCLCYLDLDRFKVVNDTCGHLAGDQLLRHVTAQLQGIFRRHDVLARAGSDEFAILMKHCTAAEAGQAARRLLTEIRATSFAWEERRFPLGVSIGMMPLEQPGLEYQAVLTAAHTACQLAKEPGGNRIHVYNEADGQIAQHVGDLRWVPRIHEAIAANRFFLEFQRIAPLHPRLSAGEHFELLIRLGEQDGRTVMPGEFLPAAEHYNVCSMIDLWVAREALRWLAAPATPLARVGLCSINLSARSLEDFEFQERLHELLANTVVPPHKLCFEITETAAMSDPSQALRFVQAIRALGCKFAVDDFGSGMASFAYLKFLPVDYVKIDGLFVRDILETPFSLAMVRSICEVAHAGGMLTVAEFAENAPIINCLRELGVDYAQGYGIARPQPLLNFGREGDP